MSGGSLEYLYSKVGDVADSIGGSPLRVAFAAHLKLVAKALHDLEWVMSCDYGPGDEDAAIRACIAPNAELDAAIALAETARKNLDAALAKAQGAP